MDRIQDLTVKFKVLGEKIGIKLLRKAAKRGGELIRDEAIAGAPRRTGNLRAQIKISTRKETPMSIEMEIGPSKKAWYGRLVEHGTKRSKAKPFLGPAIELRGDEAAAVFEATLWAETEKAWQKQEGGARSSLISMSSSILK